MKLIVACDPKGGIGYNNKLPWSNIQGDLPRFKNLTQGQVVVMGRNTWDSLPKKAINRQTKFCSV
jgi:dihydrofolate reductase